MKNQKYLLPAHSFYYVRHGQTDWNKERKLMGQQDIPLNEEGIRQAQQLAQSIQNIEISLIVASPLIRAQQTATIIANAIGKNVASVDEFKEAHGGTLEGNARDGANEALDYWRAGGIIEGAELWHHFVARVHRGLHEVLTVEHPKPVLIVAHGAVYWAVLEILKLEHESLGNCSIVLHEPAEEGTWKRRHV